MTTLTVLHVMSGDPIPGKSDDSVRAARLDAPAETAPIPDPEPPTS